jgi:thiopeptide-type bacteriocin biosynthesis protein
VDRTAWQQTNLDFADAALAERTAITHVVPLLTAAETARLISAWFIVRKGHQWRLRYRPTHAGDRGIPLRAQLHDLRDAGHLTKVTPVIYEPETTAFGGPRAMRLAHRLWHVDSRNLLTSPPPAHTRELSILFCATMMRAAGLDWYEQGDIWARVADHRDPADPAPTESQRDNVHRLLVVDPASLTHPGAPLAGETAWLDAFAAAGAALRRTHDSGQLLRGLRDVLAHHVIFAWNRRGIPAHEQAVLATTARDCIFGPRLADRPIAEPAAA